jgi:hypothetical protein
MEKAADTDPDAYEQDSSAEDNEVEVKCKKNKTRPVLVRSQTGDFHNMQEAAGMSTNLLDMREA